jgi:hypothetical protein
LVRPSGERTNSRREVVFYRDIAPLSPPDLMTRCFAAEINEATNTWHLLLEDLAVTHFVSARWPVPPTLPRFEAITTGWARFHAAWWDDPRLGHSIGTRHDQTTADAFARDSGAHFVRFADLLGDALTPERRAIFERLLAEAPRLFGRHRSHHNMTIVHGDAHAWNGFLPRDERDGVRLFDWSDWRVSLATNDLAYMMATHWYPERRRRHERRLLDHYHAQLAVHGVSGYGRVDLDDDYRLSALLQILTPVWQAAFDIPAVIWWSHHERTMLAFDDLGCRDLL